MPVHNGADFVREAVNSTLRAMPSDAELHVLDDASTDSSLELLERVRDSRMVIHAAAQNVGIARGLNRLFASTDSEFVARMDADDVCAASRFRRQLQRLRRDDAVFASALLIDGAGRIRRPDLPGTMSAASIGLHLLVASCLWHPTFAARRAVLPDEPYRVIAGAEDYDLWLRLATDGVRMSRDARPLLRYRVHGKQVSSGNASAAAPRVPLDPVLLDAYRALAAREGVIAPAGEATLRFALNGVAPTAEVDRAEVAGVLAGVRSRGRGLGPIDRASLGLRLVSAGRRLGAVA
jgi:hypothetical protein